MKRIKQYLVVFLLGCVCTACYKDKGNYDYTPVNHMEVAFWPEAVDNEYTYRQPLTDTMYVTYKAVVSQTMQEQADNLEYTWIINGGRKEKGDSLTLMYPPKKKTMYRVLCQVHDNSTGIDLYQQLNMLTELPFVRSWLVLHGAQGDRKIGCVEYPDEQATAIVTTDVYESLYKQRRFKDAEKLVYNSSGSGYDLNNFLQLTVVEPDSLFFMIVPSYKVTKTYDEIMMEWFGNRPRLLDGFSQENGYFSMLLDDLHKLYYGQGTGEYREVKVGLDLQDYQADKVFISKNGYVTVWDEENRQFMYYYFPTRVLSAFPLSIYNKTDWQDREIIWIGRGLNNTTANGATVLVREQTEYFLYHVGYGIVTTSPVTLTKVNLGELELEENPCFASSEAFDEQLFYSVGSGVYVLNTVSGDSRLLYDAGAPVTQLKFRSKNNMDVSLSKGEERMLGIAVLNGNEGELHEIVMDEAGDITTILVHKGFEPIRDICFTLVEHIIA